MVSLKGDGGRGQYHLGQEPITAGRPVHCECESGVSVGMGPVPSTLHSHIARPRSEPSGPRSGNTTEFLVGRSLTVDLHCGT